MTNQNAQFLAVIDGDTKAAPDAATPVFHVNERELEWLEESEDDAGDYALDPFKTGADLAEDQAAMESYCQFESVDFRFQDGRTESVP